MRPQVRAFRDIAAQVCHVRRFRFLEFMEDYGLEEILDEAEVDNWPATTIAGQVLLRCCVTAGKFNNFPLASRACSGPS